jgi:hypothetical protein
MWINLMVGGASTDQRSGQARCIQGHVGKTTQVKPNRDKCLLVPAAAQFAKPNTARLPKIFWF